MIAALGFIGRHGRWSLVAGLIGGLSLPGFAIVIKEWLPHLIAALLFVSAYRIGPVSVFGSLGEVRRIVLHVLCLQLVAPLLAVITLAAVGWMDTLPGLAFVLVLAAPSVSAAPNFAILMGKTPANAMQLLLVGTALFPFTVIPVLWALPAIPSFEDVLYSAGSLLIVIALAVGAAFVLRGKRTLPEQSRNALDGCAALLLGVIVIGLMSAMGPALKITPGALLLWLGFSLVLNFGVQLIAFAYLPGKNAGAAVVAGNRNIALFLVALPSEIIEGLLLFIGCYQVPMYLTPLVMGRFMRSGT